MPKFLTRKSRKCLCLKICLSISKSSTMLICCGPKLKAAFVSQKGCFHIYFTYGVQSGKCSLRKINHNPRKTIHAVPSTFSPATRRISTWKVGSPSKGRGLDQDISSSWAGDLTAYLWRVTEGDSIPSCLTMYHRQPHI